MATTRVEPGGYFERVRKAKKLGNGIRDQQWKLGELVYSQLKDKENMPLIPQELEALKAYLTRYKRQDKLLISAPWVATSPVPTMHYVSLYK